MEHIIRELSKPIEEEMKDMNLTISEKYKMGTMSLIEVLRAIADKWDKLG